jgi:phosphonate transport system substrate-binding protein
MVRLGGSTSESHLAAFQGIEAHFKQRGINIDWVLYSDDHAVVDAFVAGEIDLAWNGPLNYVRIKRRLADPCKVIAMRDVDFNFVTHFITQSNSDIITVEDLMGKRFALGSRGSVEAGLLALYFLKEAGINPARDLGACTFFEERQATGRRDQKDVVERVKSGEYEAGAVSGRSLESLQEQGALRECSVRKFWSSPGYSHCCFTAQSDMDPALYKKLEEAFESVDRDDPIGKAILEAEACNSLLRGSSEGWEIMEKAAEAEGLV